MATIKRQRLDNGDTTTLTHSLSSQVLYNHAVSLEAHNGAVYTSSFDPTGEYIASGGNDRIINIWNLPRQQQDVHVGHLYGHKNAVTSVKWLETELVSGGADLTVIFWDLHTGSIIRRSKNNGIINEIDTSDTLVVSGDDKGNVKFWDKRVKGAIDTITTPFPILSCKFNNKATNLFFSGIDSTINTYDTRDFSKPLWTCQGPVDSITSLAVNSDDSVLISRSTSGVINTFNAKPFVSVSRASPYIYEGGTSGLRLTRTCFTNDDTNIVSGSDNDVVVWDVKSRRLVNKFQGHNSHVLDIQCHPSHRIISSTGDDGSIIVREL